jgi:hypothetical protein
MRHRATRRNKKRDENDAGGFVADVTGAVTNNAM